jgi:hypothetical protein
MPIDFKQAHKGKEKEETRRIHHSKNHPIADCQPIE